ncbi:MAG: archaellin/type IV pilin N-terminal domain-containing protein [Nitrososphaerales archaeon]
MRPDTLRKKGISPVVATVILVAVAVVIAAALAGFSSSLFGTYSSTGSIELRDVIVYDDGSGIMIMKNVGSKADSVVSAQVPPQPAALGDGSDIYLDADKPKKKKATCKKADPPEPVVEANSEAVICFDGDALFDGGDEGVPVAGQQITMNVKMKSGVELTLSVIVAPEP